MVEPLPHAHLLPLQVSARLQDLPLPQSEVGPGGSLTLRNLFYDNSFVATEPSILKFTTITPYFREGTSLTVENVIFGDAHCVDWDDSVAMPILLKYTQTWATNFSMSRVNERYGAPGGGPATGCVPASAHISSQPDNPPHCAPNSSRLRTSINPTVPLPMPPACVNGIPNAGQRAGLRP